MSQTNNDMYSQKLNNVDIDLKELVQSLLKYKVSILVITLIAALIASYVLYFKPDVYSSNALIEVKSVAGGTKGNISGSDFLEGAFSGFGGTNVNKDIEILKTFHANDLVLNKINFNTRYFVDSGLKQLEFYNNSPLAVKNVTIFNRDIIWRQIKIIPVKDGFYLQIQNTFKDKILHLLLDKELLQVDGEQLHHYGTPIKNAYFELTIDKKESVNQPIYFVLLNNNRTVFEALIKNNLEITQANLNTPLITITYKDTVPQRADAYVNALADSFILQSVSEKTKGNDRIIDFINSQLTDIKKTLDESETKLENYRIKNQAIDPKLQGSTYITELTKIEIELSKNELNEQMLKNLLEYIKGDINLDSISPSLEELGDQTTLALITKLQDLQINEEGLKIQYSGKHPGLIAVRKQIQFITEKIKLNLMNLKSSMRHRNQNLKNLKQTYDENIASLPTQERILINLKRDYEVNSETYKYLLRKKSENEMIKVAILSDYRIIDPAYNSGMPIGPKHSLILLGALILGFILGIVQALLRSFMNDKIQSKKDIEDLTTIPIYGILPMLKTNKIKLEVLKNPKSPFAESFRSLRTNLQFSHKEKQSNIILISSTISGEGKTTTAANLATIFQMANYRTIVINLDLRKPTLHHYFDADNTHGMSTYLSSKHSMSEIIKSTDYQNLDIITSGPIPPNPSELILSDKLDALLESLKETYEYIIIDSAPLGLVADTMHLMQYADLSLIVVRVNYSKKPFLTDLNTLISQHKLSHIGLVVNDVCVSSSSYGYGYGYGYGHDQDKR